MEREDYLAQVKEKAAAHDVVLEDDKAELILSHLEYLIEKNKVMNLTRIDTIEDGLVLHVEDSLSIVPFIKPEHQTFCDIGTGGGFPGIPLAVATGMNGTLLDSVKKKVAAVQEFIEEAGLQDQIETLGQRAEDLAKERKEAFDVVTARAVSSVASLVELASPLLRPFGRLVVMKAQPDEKELRGGLRAADMVGLSVVDDRTITIGEGEITRRILVFEKTGKSKVKLPRRVGLAQSKPLA